MPSRKRNPKTVVRMDPATRTDTWMTFGMLAGECSHLLDIQRTAQKVLNEALVRLKPHASRANLHNLRFLVGEANAKEIARQLRTLKLTPYPGVHLTSGTSPGSSSGSPTGSGSAGDTSAPTPRARSGSGSGGGRRAAGRSRSGSTRTS